MISTISAVTQSSSVWDLNSFFGNPYVQQILSPLVVFSILGAISYKIFNLGQILTKFTQALKDIDSLEKDVKMLLSHMSIVKTQLVIKTGMDANLFSPGSPLMLLENGKKLLEKSGFKKIYSDNKQWFLDKLITFNVKNDSDIDEASYKIMEQCGNDSKFANFKEIAFQNGVVLDTLLKVLSIYLRQELIKEILDEKKQR